MSLVLIKNPRVTGSAGLLYVLNVKVIFNYLYSTLNSLTQYIDWVYGGFGIEIKMAREMHLIASVHSTCI